MNQDTFNFVSLLLLTVMNLFVIGYQTSADPTLHEIFKWLSSLLFLPVALMAAKKLKGSGIGVLSFSYVFTAAYFLSVLYVSILLGSASALSAGSLTPKDVYMLLAVEAAYAAAAISMLWLTAWITSVEWKLDDPNIFIGILGMPFLAALLSVANGWLWWLLALLAAYGGAVLSLTVFEISMKKEVKP